MYLAAEIAVGLVALIHFGIAVTEMFLFKKRPVYERLDKFQFDQKEAARIAPIVANAGLYNAFLAVGLVWSFVSTSDPLALRLFFLSCVAVAGIFGAITLKPTTLVLQTLPAAAAIALLLMAW